MFRITIVVYQPIHQAMLAIINHHFNNLLTHLLTIMSC